MRVFKEDEGCERDRGKDKAKPRAYFVKST